jgi:ferredoxin-type protein NapF
LNNNCISCGLCEKVCKGECIDSKAKMVDNTRCVDCYNCLRVCRKNAIAFTARNGISALPSEHSAVVNASVLLTAGAPRRSFLQWLTGSLLFGSAARAATLPNGLPTGQSRVSYKKNHPVLPPGAKTKGHLIHHCTACQLCVAKCPANVIQPSLTELGLQGFLVPVMKFDHGFCNFHCTICADVCPTAALLPIRTAEEKHKMQIGTVVFLEENCVVLTQGTNCGACAEHCPTGAVTMRPYGTPDLALTLPHIDVDLCVGCGACENICPVVPYRAIYVEGLEKHGEAKPAFDPAEKQQEVPLESFGF